MNDDLMSRSVTGFMAISLRSGLSVNKTEVTLRAATGIEQTHFTEKYLLVSYL
ncbi:hypothetical protein ACIA8C_36120 [Nocardia sp. NPDC051321]|uniref:hypothetical protein n=1 Tax=Nocardia sp. NPDC051321 TaxID=3364323 RepID=UPI003795D0AA